MSILNQRTPLTKKTMFVKLNKTKKREVQHEHITHNKNRIKIQQYSKRICFYKFFINLLIF